MVGYDIFFYNASMIGGFGNWSFQLW